MELEPSLDQGGRTGTHEQRVRLGVAHQLGRSLLERSQRFFRDAGLGSVKTDEGLRAVDGRDHGRGGLFSKPLCEESDGESCARRVDRRVLSGAESEQGIDAVGLAPDDAAAEALDLLDEGFEILGCPPVV